MKTTGQAFISYARADGAEFAHELRGDLEKRHIPTWLDTYDIDPGKPFYEEIDRGLRQAKAILVILTPGAVMSQQVMAEWNSALNQLLPVIPLLVTSCNVPTRLSVLNWIDFREEYQAGFVKLRRRLDTIYETHLNWLQEQVARFEAAQATTNNPETYQPKIDDYRQAIKHWKKQFVVEKEKHVQTQARIEQVAQSGGYRKNMTDIFVGRNAQLNRLHRYLNQTLQGQSQTCFIKGEAGSGKTVLLKQFVRRAENEHEELIFVHGTCNIQTGVSDPYLPFRHILEQLIGSTTDQGMTGAMTDTNRNRLQQVLHTTGRALVETAPELIGSVIPGGGILAALGRMAAKEQGVLKKLGLEERAQQAAQNPLDVKTDQIMYQYTQFLRAIANEYPLIIALDDLQWADESSIGLFQELSSRLQDSPVMLVGLYRPNDVETDRRGKRHPLAAPLAEIKGKLGNIEIDLDKAREQEGREFVNAFLDTEPNELSEQFRQKLYERTGGQPLFTVELVRTMQENGDLIQNDSDVWVEADDLSWDEMPFTVETVIEERVERLEAELRELLTIASVEGQNFTAQVVARIQEADEKGIIRALSRKLQRRHKLVQELDATRINRTHIARFTFSHALFQKYLYETLGIAERRFLHEDVAEILEDLYADQTESIAAQLAQHYVAAGYAEKAVPYLRQAAERALRIGAFSEALEQAQQGLEMLKHESSENAGEEKARLLHLRGLVLYRLGQREDAISDFEQAIAISHELEMPELRVRPLLDLGNARRKSGKLEEALKYLEEALETAQQTNDKEAEVDSMRRFGITVGRIGNHDKEMSYIQQSYELAVDVDYALGQILGLNSLAIRERRFGKLKNAANQYREAIQIAEDIGNKHRLAMCQSNLGEVHSGMGKWQQAIKDFELALKIDKTTGRLSGQAYRYNGMGAMYYRQDENHKALAVYQQAYEIGKEIGETELLVQSLGGIGRIYLRQNKLGKAAGNLSRAIDFNFFLSLPRWLSLYAVTLARQSTNLLAKETALKCLPESKKHPEQYYSTHYPRGLAQATLAVLSTGDEQTSYLSQAIDSYRKALDICSAFGILAEQRMYFDELAVMDKENILAPIKEMLDEAYATAKQELDD